MSAPRAARTGEPHVTALVGFPMHGHHKLVAEGYRTRDGHLIEWFGRLMAAAGSVDLYSRPEPFPRRQLAMRGARHAPATNTRDFGPSVIAFPSAKARHMWWKSSLRRYSVPPVNDVPAVVWNPLAAITNAAPSLMSPGRRLLFDLLDDWTIHPAFRGFSAQVELGYQTLFDRADAVTANSEGTLALAHRFGRSSDAILMPNGCDPERFTQESAATGPTTVGYLGKIGTRLDFVLISQVVAALRHFHFVFAGPVLDADLPTDVRGAPNVTVLGDVPYGEVPQLLTSFDVGWVPHAVGPGEVGGDAIKIYEYRAAGLPVLTTPIIGTRERWGTGVEIADGRHHSSWLQSLPRQDGRVARMTGALDPTYSWQHKARAMLKTLGLDAG